MVTIAEQQGQSTAVRQKCRQQETDLRADTVQEQGNH